MLASSSDLTAFDAGEAAASESAGRFRDIGVLLSIEQRLSPARKRGFGRPTQGLNEPAAD